MSEPKLFRRPLPPKAEAVLLIPKRKHHRQVTSPVQPGALGEESKEVPGDGEGTDVQTSVSIQSHCILLSLPDSVGGTTSSVDYCSSSPASGWEPRSLSSPGIARNFTIPVQNSGPPSFPLKKRRIPLGLKLPTLKRHRSFLPFDFILKGSPADDLDLHGIRRVRSAHRKQITQISHFNYEVFSRQLIRDLQWSDQEEVSTIFFPAPEFPFAEARKPDRQVLTEKYLAHRRKSFKAAGISEDEEYEEKLFLQEESKRTKKKQVTYADSVLESGELSLLSGVGCRSQGGPEDEEKELMTRAEMAVLCCLMHKRTGLSLKGFFLPRLPDLSMLADFLLYLNLSFNDLHLFPTEVCDLINLQVLKLRNNPIEFIPEDIKKMKSLKTLIISFNLLTELPSWLFMLPNLELLDASYNELERISNAISNARNLSCLIIEGNLLWALPSGILKVDLKCLRVENNFLHPLFWNEFRPQPQRLTDMAALYFVQNNLQEKYSEIPENIQELLDNCDTCDGCSGPLYGEGLHFLRAYKNIYGLRLPYTFSACSPACYKDSVI